MEFKYSRLICSLEADTGGLAGDLLVRCHIDRWRELAGVKAAQQIWIQQVGSLPMFHGCSGPQFGLLQVAVPECLPERLEVIAYACEIGFLYDDWTEFHQQDELEFSNDELQVGLTQRSEMGSTGTSATGIKKVQAVLLEKMIAIDRPRALFVMETWAEFLSEAAGRSHKKDFQSIQDYMRYRVLDVGEMFWLGLVTFGMALSIPRHELALVRTFTAPCWVILALQNDICSYKKEVAASIVRGEPVVMNAMVILQKTNEVVGIEEAEAWCRRRINDCLHEYRLTLEVCANDERLSGDSKIYMEALLYTISGDAAWSLVAPRYSEHHIDL